MCAEDALEIVAKENPLEEVIDQTDSGQLLESRSPKRRTRDVAPHIMKPLTIVAYEAVANKKPRASKLPEGKFTSPTKGRKDSSNLPGMDAAQFTLYVPKY